MSFIEACCTNNLDEAIKLYKLGADIHEKNKYAFRYSCSFGYFQVVKWDAYANIR